MTTYKDKFELPLMTDDWITDEERAELRKEAQECVEEYETTWCVI